MKGERRFRWLIGSAAVTGLFWAIDMFGPTPKDAPAKGAAASDLPALKFEDRAKEVTDAVVAFESRLTRRLQPEAIVFSRDPFEPDERWLAVLAAPREAAETAAATAAATAQAEIAPPPPTPPPAVQGVMTGAPALVVIGDRTLPVGAIVGGWRIAKIERGFVVFEREGRSERVEIGQAP